MNYENTRALALLGNYLNERADFISPGEVHALAELGLTPEHAVAQLVAAACGLDIENNAEDKALFQTYFNSNFHLLDAQKYGADDYLRLVRFPVGLQQQGISFCTQQYRPYECFVCNDFRRGMRGEALAQIGFFEQAFSYPAVLENGRLWMSVTPNEIETMRGAIGRARGRVVTYGLGLGYFAFHASQKPEVLEVTVVEKNPQLISLFSTHILPQFKHTHKIKIVEQDALDFADKADVVSCFDYVFADLWRDVSDGLTLYRRLKRLEPAGICADYWIEETLRCYL
ncbi:MAG: hypothetical protein MJ053_00940 [Elusimicrobiaceae bacterium]|nr:hypothetical protein [Elusimicrobiaceae bacterium]